MKKEKILTAYGLNVLVSKEVPDGEIWISLKGHKQIYKYIDKMIPANKKLKSPKGK